MAKKNIEDKEKMLKKLKEDIVSEKRKINESLGKAIITSMNIPYGSVDDDKIAEFCKVLTDHYTNKDTHNG